MKGWRWPWAAALLSVTSCSTEPSKQEGPLPGEGVVLPSGETFTREALLTAASQCVRDQLNEFDVRAATFSNTAAAAEADPSRRTAAQNAWIAAMEIWQRLELMQLGPLAASAQPGGEGLRDEIYSWPLVNRCSIDQSIVDQSFAQASFATSLVNQRGLAAAEYLLFRDDAESSCSESAEIVTSGAWDALGPSELEQRRARYTSAVAADVRVKAEAALVKWGDPGHGYFAALSGAGSDSKLYKNQRIALNSVSDALFYVEWATKDAKLGAPVGLVNCAASICPDALESPYAKRSLQHVRNNLIGFRKIFTGCGDDGGGLGFDDWLYAVGVPELGGEIDARVVEAITLVDAMPEKNLALALQSDAGSVRALYDAVKRITDLLRTQFISVLDLELPARVEGDND